MVSTPLTDFEIEPMSSRLMDVEYVDDIGFGTKALGVLMRLRPLGPAEAVRQVRQVMPWYRSSLLDHQELLGLSMGRRRCLAESFPSSYHGPMVLMGPTQSAPGGRVIEHEQHKIMQNSLSCAFNGQNEVLNNENSSSP